MTELGGSIDVIDTTLCTCAMIDLRVDALDGPGARSMKIPSSNVQRPWTGQRSVESIGKCLELGLLMNDGLGISTLTYISINADRQQHPSTSFRNCKYSQLILRQTLAESHKCP